MGREVGREVGRGDSACRYLLSDVRRIPGRLMNAMILGRPRQL